MSDEKLDANAILGKFFKVQAQRDRLAARVTRLEQALRLMVAGSHCQNYSHNAEDCAGTSLDKSEWCAWCVACEALGEKEP